jgi:nucleoside 2-deoxyribosyltransferase
MVTPDSPVGQEQGQAQHRDYDDDKAKEVLFSMAKKAAEADLVIAYLPNASMGTALEMIRAYDSGKPVFTISPMSANWFIIAVSTRIFSTLDEFIQWVSENKIVIE